MNYEKKLSLIREMTKLGMSEKEMEETFRIREKNDADTRMMMSINPGFNWSLPNGRYGPYRHSPDDLEVLESSYEFIDYKIYLEQELNNRDKTIRRLKEELKTLREIPKESISIQTDREDVSFKTDLNVIGDTLYIQSTKIEEILFEVSQR